MTEHPILKTVYFVRHGQSKANVSPEFQSPDSPLNDRGREQAQKIASRVAHIAFDHLVASSYARARETAETIAQVTGKVPEYSDLFVERIKPTSINGKPYGDEAANRAWRAWEESLSTPGQRVEDGENLEDILNRADRALAFLEAQEAKEIVVVSHGYFIRTVLARVLFGELLSGPLFKRFQQRAEMQNTGISVIRLMGAFEEETRWRLWIHNDHAHLG